MDEEESMYEHSARVKASSPYEQSNNSQSPFSDNRYSSVPSVGPTVSSFNTAPTQPRQSIDVYGAFSDPAPTGFAADSNPPRPSSFASPPESPRVSRTMQYADPYAAVRSAVTQGPSPPPPNPSAAYDPYPGYR